MRASLYSTVAVLAILVPAQAGAADISEAGAQEIRDALTYYLPADIANSGFIKVTPGTKRYELSLDFQPLLKNIKPETFTITGLRPFVHYLTPQDDEQWKVELNDHLDVSGSIGIDAQKSTFRYKIGKIVFDGLFDPAISYFSESTASAENIEVSTETGPAKVSATIASVRQQTSATEVSPGLIDIDGEATIDKMVETIEDPSTGPVLVNIGSMTAGVEIKKLGIAAARDLVVFLLDKVKADTKEFSAADSQKFKDLLKANIPFVDDLSEDIALKDVKVNAQGMEATLAELGYSIEFSGIKADSRVAFGLSAEDPVIPAGLLPPGTEPALPDSASFNVAVTSLNLEGAMNYLVEHADFTKSEPLTPEQSTEIGKIVLPDGLLHIEFSDVTAKSDVYDISVSGTMLVDPNNSDKPEADVTIVANQFDQSIEYLQKNAHVVPQFGQAAFMGLAFKGFAKQEEGGKLSWNVKVSKDGKVTVNGQPMEM